jgi:hypothetical protein
MTIMKICVLSYVVASKKNSYLEARITTYDCRNFKRAIL